MILPVQGSSGELAWTWKKREGIVPGRVTEPLARPRMEKGKYDYFPLEDNGLRFGLFA